MQPTPRPTRRPGRRSATNKQRLAVEHRPFDSQMRRPWCVWNGGIARGVGPSATGAPRRPSAARDPRSTNPTGHRALDSTQEAAAGRMPRAAGLFCSSKRARWTPGKEQGEPGGRWLSGRGPGVFYATAPNPSLVAAAGPSALHVLSNTKSPRGSACLPALPPSPLPALRALPPPRRQPRAQDPRNRPAPLTRTVTPHHTPGRPRCRKTHPFSRFPPCPCPKRALRWIHHC